MDREIRITLEQLQWLMKEKELTAIKYLKLKTVEKVKTIDVKVIIGLN